jgi:hypothetical protein
VSPRIETALMRMSAKPTRGREPGEHPVEAAAAGDPLEDVLPQAVEADVEPCEAGGGELLRLILEQQAVGRQGHLVDAADRL